MSEFGSAFSDIMGTCLAVILAGLIGLGIVILILRWVL